MGGKDVFIFMRSSFARCAKRFLLLFTEDKIGVRFLLLRDAEIVWEYAFLSARSEGA